MTGFTERLREAVALEKQGRAVEALQAYQALHREAPANTQVHLALSALLNELHFPEQAARFALMGLQLKPEDPGLQANFGMACFQLESYDEAVQHLAEACRLEPKRAAHFFNLGRTLQLLGEHGEARPVLQEALRLEPTYVEAAWGLALLDLMEGHYQEGWQGYELRWQRPELEPDLRNWEKPLWQGEDLRNQRLLVHTEQGLGDAIMMARFLPPLVDQAQQVFLEVQPSLMGLFGTLCPCPHLIPRGSPLPEYDLHLPIMSLPRVLGLKLEDLQDQKPYLHVPDQVPHRLKLEQSLQMQGLRIGLVLSGNPRHVHDHWRSLSDERVQELLDFPGSSFFWLQPGDRKIQDPRITDLGPFLSDFSDTAYALSQMDLVISVDTSVAHLAGAMGSPCYLLLAYMSDWRWLWGRSDSPWYPSLRLFRQSYPNDWEGLLKELLGELSRRAVQELD